MLPNEALDKVLEIYKISAADISRATGLDKTVISKYRNGHQDIGSKKLQQIILSLPPEAKTHYHLLFAYDNYEIQNRIIYSN